MKKYLMLIVFCLFTGATTTAQTFDLSISGGSGSGTYAKGDTIHVWADPAFDNDVFTNWAGDGQQFLINGNEWHNQIVVPLSSTAENISLTANFATLSDEIVIETDSLYLFGINADQEEVRTYKDIHVGLPPADVTPKAIVFLIHGTDGSGASWFRRFERYQLVKELIYNGYAVFGVDANETTLGDIDGDGLGHWENDDVANADTSNNIDLKNMSLTRDSLIAKYGYPQDISVFSLGMSNGSNFSDLAATRLNYVASIHNTAKGKDDLYIDENIAPILWIASENDHQENADNQIAQDNFDQAFSRQQTSEFHWFRRSPVYPERFYRSLKGITLAESIQIYDSLASQGFLDENNRLIPLDTDTFLAQFYADNNDFGLSSAKLKAARDQFLCVNAGHVLNSDFTKNILRFFDQALFSVSNENDGSNSPTSQATIYPNPFSGSATIRFTQFDQQAVNLTIYDVLGKVVKYIQVDQGNNTSINRNGLANGVYFYIISAGGNETLITGKFVVH